MATDFELALMSYKAYGQSDANKVEMASWTENADLSRATSSGFAASVYAKGDEVVVAFRGTDNPQLSDFWNGNLPAADGTYSEQVVEAIQRISDVMAAYPGKTITLTGHSLGGGLASLMAVFFDLSAVVFDPAPFGNTAQDEYLLPQPGSTLGLYFGEYVVRQNQLDRALDPSFVQYNQVFYAEDDEAAQDALYAQRSSGVTGYYLQGEILTAARAASAFFPTIMAPGGLTPVLIGSTTLNDAILDTYEWFDDATALHSMSLLLAMMASPALRSASAQLPTLLELIKDQSLYAVDDNSDNTNFLNRLLQDQLADGVNTQGKALDKFAADLLKLAGAEGLVQTDDAVRDALIVVAIEYYNFKDLDQATSLFTQTDGGIHFKYSDIGASQYKSLIKLKDAVLEMLDIGLESTLASRLVQQNAWHIQSGTNPLNWSVASDDNQNDAMIGGGGADTMDAGLGNDILIGNGGDDVLSGGNGEDILLGGAGSDTLSGGEGNDTYIFDDEYGVDKVIGDDNDGKIIYDGITLTGANATSVVDPLYVTRPSWSWTEGGQQFHATLVEGDLRRGGTLWITKGAGLGTDRVVVEQYKFGDLGLVLSSDPKTALLPDTHVNPFVTADYTPPTLTTHLAEGGARTVTVALSAGALAGDKLRISASELPESLFIVTGAEELAFNNGTVDLILNAGQTSVTFSLLERGDVDNDTNLTLSATLLDAQGQAVGTASSLNVALDARVEKDTYDFVYYAYDPRVQFRAHYRTPSTGGSELNPSSGPSEVIDLSGSSADVEYLVEAGLGDSYLVGTDFDDALEDGLYRIDEYTTNTHIVVFGGQTGDNDQLFGGAGNDVLQTHGGDDRSYGGEGNDLIIDTPIANHTQGFEDLSWARAEGHSNNDQLYGEAGNDILVAGAGNALMDGGIGDDRLYGGADDDTLLGGEGNDVLRGDNHQTGRLWTYFNGDLIGGLNVTVSPFGEPYSLGDVVKGSVAPGKDFLDGGAGNDDMNGGGNDDVMFGGLGDDSMVGDDSETASTAGGDYLDGEGGNDKIAGWYGDDVLSGGSGDDKLSGGGDDSWNFFGTHLLDFDGNDTFLYDRGGGHDQIYQVGAYYSRSMTGERDVIRFGGNIKPEDLVLSINATGDLGIQFRNADGSLDGADSLIIRGYFVSPRVYGTETPSRLERTIGQFEFTGSGQVYTAQQLESMLLAKNTTGSDYYEGTEGGESIVMQGGADVVFGYGGDDQITVGEDWSYYSYVYGGDGNDIITGWGELRGDDGDDVLHGGPSMVGGTGSDTYLYNLGDHEFTIKGELDIAPSSIDKLQLGAGIRPQDVILRGEYDKLIVTVINPATGSEVGEIVVESGLSTASGSAVLDEIHFADGTVWQRGDISTKTTVLSGGLDKDNVSGTVLDDVLYGAASDDYLYGNNGNDDLTGGTGNDQLNGGKGNDTYRFGALDGSDVLYDTLGSNQLVLDAGITPDRVALIRISSPATFGNGSSTDDALLIVIDGGASQLYLENYFRASGTKPIAQLVFGDGTIWDSAAIEAHVVDQSGTASSVTGTAGNDTYVVDHRSDVITESANAGTDTVLSSVTYRLPTNVENLTLTGSLSIGGSGNTLVNVITGNDAINVLDSVSWNPMLGSSDSGADTLIGGKGDDTYYVDTQWNGLDNFTDIVVEQANEGYDTLYAQDVYSALLPENVEALVIDDIHLVFTSVQWNSSQDVRRKFVGNSLDNLIVASSASSGFGTGLSTTGFNEAEVVIDGGAGADTMVGGNRATRFIVDNVNDVVVASTTTFADIVESSVSYTLSDGADNLELTGTVNISGTGNALNNTLDGTKNNSSNTLAGGRGDDTYRVDGLDVIQEYAGEGTDTAIYSGTSGYTLGNNVENLTSTSASAVTLVGNAIDNIIVSGGGNDYLNGGDGNDQLQGGAGSDVYAGFGPTTGMDIIIDTSINGSADQIQFLSTSSLNIEQLQFSVVGNDLLIAVDAGNSIRIRNGNSSHAIQQFKFNQDGLWYTYSSAQMESRASGSNAAPTVNAALVNQSMMATQAFSYQLAANTFADIDSQHSLIYKARLSDGNALPSWLVFDAATRTFSGTAPSYDVGIYSVAVTATDEGGLSAWTAFTISVTPVTLTGTAGNDTLIGEVGATVIYGLQGDDLLDGGAGADTLVGGLGDDTYIVDDAGDEVTESANEGVDSVESSVSYTIGDNIENLTLTGIEFINGTGNSLDNILIGNTVNNTLDGGSAGADSLYGGLGDDVYIVSHSSGITIIENVDEGRDSVRASATHTLLSNVEDLVLTGTGAINGTGNSLDNEIVGNDAANVLTGIGGNDVLIGGLGNDVYSGGAGDDWLDDWQGGGADTLDGGDGSDGLMGGVGNDTYYGGAGDDYLDEWEGDGDDYLDGGTGADEMWGEGGNDTYVIDDVGDLVWEEEGLGTDLVRSSITYTLADNVENLILTGTASINGIGNTLANTLTGNSGANVLDGGVGADTLVGGAGNDTYVVDNTGDVVTEASSAGTDLVQSSITYALGSNVENLTLTGVTAINGTGNTLANVLTGNSAANTLNGGSGADTMLGGLGNDIYVVAQTGDVVTENADEGVDLVQASVTYTLSSNVENLTLTGSSAISGTGNTLDNILTGNSANNTLTGGAGNDTLNGGTGTDTMVGGTGNDIYFVNVSGDITTENANEGIDTVNSAVTRTLAANIEALFLTGTSAINGTGNTLANLLRGNTANNTLAGGGGTDILEGGAGNDILSDTGGNTFLNGGAGTDTLTGTANNDLLIGGTGNDALTTGQGADIIAFNKGDGQDTLVSSTTKDNTLSIGGGTVYADLLFQKSGNNLILKVGATDQITFTNYYASTSNRSINTLQVILEGSSDYNAASTDALYNKKVESFNFDGLVAAFDAARTANPSLTTWALSGALVAQYLSGSDTAALGGDLAYQYGRFGNETNVSYTPAIGILGSGSFGTSAQTLQALSSLQDASPRLS